MTVRLTRRALADLDSIFDYIAHENPDAAKRVRSALLEMFGQIERRPNLGTQDAATPELRSRLVPRYQYRVHYEVTGADVNILHIRHTSRRPVSDPND